MLRYNAFTCFSICCCGILYYWIIWKPSCECVLLYKTCHSLGLYVHIYVFGAHWVCADKLQLKRSVAATTNKPTFLWDSIEYFHVFIVRIFVWVDKTICLRLFYGRASFCAATQNNNAETLSTQSWITRSEKCHAHSTVRLFTLAAISTQWWKNLVFGWQNDMTWFALAKLFGSALNTYGVYMRRCVTVTSNSI